MATALVEEQLKHGTVIRFKGDDRELLWLVPLFAMFLILVVTAEVLSYLNGKSAIGMIARYGGKALRLLPFVASIGILCQFLIAIARDYRTAVDQVMGQWRAALLNPYLLAARVAPIIMMPFFFASFSVLKMLMPRYVPFWLDEPFARIDQFLFFWISPLAVDPCGVHLV